MTSLQTGQGLAFLRTPDEAFQGLDGFGWPANYIDFDGLRLAYVDVGPREGPVALLMHGMPTWSFLNRHIIARLVSEGWRCVAADHIGFGRSDKPTKDSWYSIARHKAAHRALIEALDLRDITLLVQDWGGPIGLGQVASMPQRFARLVIMNTWLHHEGYAYTDALRHWNSQWKTGGLFAEAVPDKLSLGWFMLVSTGYMTAPDLFAIVARGVYPAISAIGDATRAGYDAPFLGLGREGHAGPRRFPLSLPFDNPAGGDAEGQAHTWSALKHWDRPVHFIWGGDDTVFTEGWGRTWASQYRQATFDLLPDAGHFLQETHGAEIAAIFLARKD